MKIAVAGHSLIHPRQQRFFLQVAELGHQVLLVMPSQWGTLRATSSDGPGDLLSRALPVLAGEGDMYQYRLVGLEGTLQEFQPDILYVQQEMTCHFTGSCIQLARDHGWTLAAFVWENLRPLTDEGKERLKSVDLLVCGNDEAVRLHPEARFWTVLPQVGVDMDHFQARPDVSRETSVAFAGRAVAEKGIDLLGQAWPTARLLAWTDFRWLPWLYSQAKVIVCHSLDTPQWKEQAMPYVAVEALANGCAVVASDAGAIPFWLGGGFSGRPCPGAIITPQGDVAGLRQGIDAALGNWEEMGQAGRVWVKQYLGSKAVAQLLVERLSLAVQEHRNTLAAGRSVDV